MADASATAPTKLLARDAELLKDTVREAGSLALSLFGTELKNWTKGSSSPVSEADIAVNDLLETQAAVGNAGLRLAVGGKRRRRAAAFQAPGMDRRSDRRHPRLSRRPRGLVRQRGAGRGRVAAARGGVCAGQRRVLLCHARAGRDAQRGRRAHDAGHRARFLARGRSETSGRAVEPLIRARSRCIRESVRWRCGSAGLRKAVSMPRLPAVKAATGILPRRI